ncbi:MAG: CcoQ/FixQ family Cbb3-type cytochrome c oxidase assembly chaperone [Nitrosomonadales bacterium]|jgi:cbb3-type cytochrome oxidase subunit 3|nr:MAG: CcoQ/FixQ family Cbb3-type cytochrome c oxidase assembly chaperone [Nitrosomonadales bacterium]
MEWLLWFTKFENTKPLSLVIFFTVFCLILYYLYGNRQRGQQLETFKNIPFLDDIQGEIQDEKGKQS